MANILKNDGLRTAKNLPDATIPPGTVFTGDIETAGGVRVDGTVKGKVSAGGDVTIGVDGIIEGGAKACNVNLAGKIIGNITAAGAANMLAGSKIVGDLAATCFAIEKGAYFKGKCTITDNSEQPMLSAPKSEFAESAEPKASEPKASEPEAFESKTSKPEAAEPEASEPEAAEPEASESKAAESEAAKSEVIVPETKQEAEKKLNSVKSSVKQSKHKKR